MDSPREQTHTFTRREVAGELDEAGLAWLRATRLGFNQSRGSDENLARWWDVAVEDGQRWRAAHRQQARADLGLEAMPVATLGSATHRVNVGGTLLDSDYILDVTVRPSDQGRGLMRRLMTDELHWAREHSIPLASLTATEGGLYGRFGFGVATWRQEVEVSLGDRFQLRHAPGLVVEQADPLAISAAHSRLHDDFVARHRSAHQPLAWRRDFHSGAWNWETMARHDGMRTLVALEGPVIAGITEIVGITVFTIEDRTVQVLDMVGSARAELALWQQLARLPLVDRARSRAMQAGSGLRAALEDPRVVSVKSESDQLWLRILDLPTALEARGWEGTGEVVLAVDDPLGITGGCWHLAVTDEGASCTPAPEATAELHLGIDTLASCYFGALPLTTLAAAGLVEGSQEAVHRFQRMLAVAEPPRNLSLF